MGSIRKRRLNSSHVIILGFSVAILTGALLLMLPISSASGRWTSFSDAVFTATSAVCVTGLAVHDTATYWSLFGQAVILGMIQIGGLGIVTIAVSAIMISGKKIGLMQRSTMQEAISAHHVGGIIRLTGFIIKTTFVIELLGAVLLSPVFVKEFGLRGIWMSVFHSISAFCNAGFDLMGIREPFSSLTAYSSDALINIVIILLIIIGGIGFLVWDDIRNNKYHWKRYRMQTKVVLLTSAVLIILPAIYFYFSEFSHISGKDRFFSALFQAVTPRTAGFNTADLNKLSPTGLLVTIILMLIGGSPGSTAGGMKTTTVAVLLFTTISVFFKKDDVECFDRRVADLTIRNTVAILLMYLTLFITGGVIISNIEGLPLMTCLFETASAIGTVGLSLGITGTLCGLSRAILIILMFFGRVGGLTVIFAAISNKGLNISKKPLEKITVG